MNDVLGSIGDETRVASGSTGVMWYNLWHEIPVDERGSDVFRGYWGTLMQLHGQPPVCTITQWNVSTDR